MKILCLCSGGNVRSVHTAALLKHSRQGQYEALAAGVHTSSKETIEMLCQWAERILICGNNLVSMVPSDHQDKVHQLGIGEDVWGLGKMNQDLFQIADRELRKAGL